MKKTYLLTAGTLAALMLSPVVLAADVTSANDQKQFDQRVHDYLVGHPEVLLEVSQVLQEKQQHKLQDQAKAAISDNAKDLLSGELTSVGSPKAGVTLVEFFDYQCIHCKHMATLVEKLSSKDKNLRVVYKEFPIFGNSSETAAKAALAAAIQGKYVPMHNALFNIEQRLDDKLVMDAAKSLGLDMEKLKKDMSGPTVTGILDANRKLAEKMHLMGTPAFVIASTPKGVFNPKVAPSFVPGASTEDALQGMIKVASAN